jgi:hypothetical protein
MRCAFLRLMALALPVGLFTSCGAMGSRPSPPQFQGTTKVLVLMTSTANDKLVQFVLVLESLALTDTAGNSVALYNNPKAAGLSGSGPSEWMHLNGASEPLVTVSVPQGIYNTATVKAGYCSFTVVTANSMGSETLSTNAQDICGQRTGNTTVNLPSPLTISGPATVLSLNLQVPQSYTLTGSGAPFNYTISPVFTLTPLAVSAQPTNLLNGKMGPILGQVTSVDSTGSGFMAQTSDQVSINVKSDGDTTYQGIDGLSSLLTGMRVEMDLAVQPDASLLATRVEAQDAAAPAEFVGPMLEGPNRPYPGWFRIFEFQEVGCINTGPPLCGGNLYQYLPNTIFSVSGQFGNLQTLPFPASFSPSSMFLGQNVSAFSSGVANSQGVESVTTVTLAPQTINGTISAVSTSNGFDVYTVALAPYDVTPALQQTGEGTNPVNKPAILTVYADANTQRLNSTPLSIGSAVRFTGLIFDDNGTLRMDCGQILDGVPE